MKLANFSFFLWFLGMNSTQGLTLTRQGLYHLDHSPTSFLFLVISYVGSHIFGPVHPEL
jgi:hypothetical protein